MSTTAASRSRVGTVILLALVLLIIVLRAAPAFAHGGDDPKDALDAVRQAIAYIVNEPGNMEMITDKVGDAIESQDQTGVDVALVKQAQAAVARNNMTAARVLLERAIGAASDLTGTDVQPILQVPAGQSAAPLATGEQTGTNVVSNPMPGRAGLTGADWALLGVAGLLAAIGAALARRWRPADSLRQLRERAVKAEARR
jgi:hypothetical protein